MEEKLIRPSQAAELLGIHERSVIRYLSKGVLMGRQNPLSRRWLLSESSAKTLLKKAQRAANIRERRDGITSD